MKRFLFSTLAGHGHLNPLVPLARALQGAGHEVAFAARELVRARVEALGFPFFAVGSDRELDPEFQAFKPIKQSLPLNVESELLNYTKLFCGISARLVTPGLVETAQNWKPDVIVREAGEYGAMIAAEHLNLPYAVVCFGAALKSVLYLEQNGAQSLDPIRQSWGLPPDPGLERIYHYLHLVYSPPTFSTHEISDDWTARVPPNTHFIRPDIFDNTASEQLPDWVTQLPDQPTIYITLGTEVNKIPEIYPRVLQTIITGLRDAPYNLIVTLGRDKDPADFGEQPPNVHIERYIPQSLLLPYCDLMVMHGGSNSLLAALDVGMPLVIVPMIADQFFNAYVTEKVGLGRDVGLDDMSPSTIQEAVKDALHNPAYRDTARRLQAEMHALPDQAYAVELVERLAAESPK